MNISDKVFVAGHHGMVGSSIVRLLKKLGYTNILIVPRKELDLTNQQEVNNWFEKNKPDYVFLAAAKVGGILSNKTYPANFIYDNLMIQTNIIHASYVNKVKKLLFLGSSCIYPKENPIPIKENRLLNAPLEPTNEAYALSKIAGLKMCEHYNNQYGCNFVSVMPCNLYGPNDCFDLEKCHVLPALINKYHSAKLKNDTKISVWGTGIARREFLYVDDLSEALYFVMQTYNKNEFINIGSGYEITMKELFNIISDVVEYKGDIEFDTSKPDGTISKLIDSTRINELGWKPNTSLRDGIKTTYNWYISNLN
jgi:GDP-L-fucose synthase